MNRTLHLQVLHLTEPPWRIVGLAPLEIYPIFFLARVRQARVDVAGQQLCFKKLKKFANSLIRTLTATFLLLHHGVFACSAFRITRKFKANLIMQFGHHIISSFPQKTMRNCINHRCKTFQVNNFMTVSAHFIDIILPCG